MDPAGFARPSLPGGLKAPKAYRLGAFRHGFLEAGIANPEGNGVHQLVSGLPWVFRGGTDEAPLGPDFGWALVSGLPWVCRRGTVVAPLGPEFSSFPVSGTALRATELGLRAVPSSPFGQSSSHFRALECVWWTFQGPDGGCRCYPGLQTCLLSVRPRNFTAPSISMTLQDWAGLWCA